MNESLDFSLNSESGRGKKDIPKTLSLFKLDFFLPARTNDGSKFHPSVCDATADFFEQWI